jgi:hypothetical protein
MFEYTFPIFCFGVLITAIVVKGLLTAAEMNKSRSSGAGSAPGRQPITWGILTGSFERRNCADRASQHRPEPENPVR